MYVLSDRAAAQLNQAIGQVGDLRRRLDMVERKGRRGAGQVFAHLEYAVSRDTSGSLWTGRQVRLAADGSSWEDVENGLAWDETSATGLLVCQNAQYLDSTDVVAVDPVGTADGATRWAFYATPRLDHSLNHPHKASFPSSGVDVVIGAPRSADNQDFITIHDGRDFDIDTIAFTASETITCDTAGDNYIYYLCARSGAGWSATLSKSDVWPPAGVSGSDLAVLIAKAHNTAGAIDWIWQEMYSSPVLTSMDSSDASDAPLDASDIYDPLKDILDCGDGIALTWDDVALTVEIDSLIRSATDELGNSVSPIDVVLEDDGICDKWWGLQLSVSDSIELDASNSYAVHLVNDEEFPDAYMQYRADSNSSGTKGWRYPPYEADEIWIERDTNYQLNHTHIAADGTVGDVGVDTTDSPYYWMSIHLSDATDYTDAEIRVDVKGHILSYLADGTEYFPAPLDATNLLFERCSDGAKEVCDGTDSAFTAGAVYVLRSGALEECAYYLGTTVSPVTSSYDPDDTTSYLTCAACNEADQSSLYFIRCDDSTAYIIDDDGDALVEGSVYKVTVSPDVFCAEYSGATSITPTHVGTVAGTAYTDCTDCSDALAGKYAWLKCSDDSLAANMTLAYGPSADYAWVCVSSAYTKCYNGGLTANAATEPTWLEQPATTPASCADLKGYPVISVVLGNFSYDDGESFLMAPGSGCNNLPWENISNEFSNSINWDTYRTSAGCDPMKITIGGTEYQYGTPAFASGGEAIGYNSSWGAARYFHAWGLKISESGITGAVSKISIPISSYVSAFATYTGSFSVRLYKETITNGTDLSTLTPIQTGTLTITSADKGSWVDVSLSAANLSAYDTNYVDPSGDSC